MVGGVRSSIVGKADHCLRYLHGIRLVCSCASHLGMPDMAHDTIHLCSSGWALHNDEDLKQTIFNLLTRLAPTDWLQEYAVRTSGIGHIGQTPEAWVESYAIKKWNRPPTFDNLSFVFTDEFGRTWWEYPQSMGLPMARMEASLQNVSMLQVLVTDEQLTELRENANLALAKGDLITAGAVLSRFFDMRSSIRCLDIMVNSVALTLVRSDESPTAFDAVIHQDKINYLKDSIERGDGFFLKLNEVKKLSERFKISADHWSTWLQEYQELRQEAKRESEAIRLMLSDKE